jgi:ring-1,2-phenylacetyl-CoA epoxidase subunit PaaC
LFDAYELEHLTHLIGSSFQPISEIAAKIRSEELYHLRHTSNWIRRLGLGTEESNRRTQLALDSLWPFTGQLFELSPAQEPLIDEGMLPDPELLRSRWIDSVGTFLRQSELIIPSETPISFPRNKHTVHLTELLEEMQQVARLDPVARW